MGDEDDEERIGSIQNIQSPKLQCFAVNRASSTVAQVPRLGAPTAVAGTAGSSLSASPARSSTVVPRRFLRRRDDCDSCHQTLHSDDASLECSLDHHHSLCIVMHCALCYFRLHFFAYFPFLFYFKCN